MIRSSAFIALTTFALIVPGLGHAAGYPPYELSGEDEDAISEALKQIALEEGIGFASPQEMKAADHGGGEVYVCGYAEVVQAYSGRRPHPMFRAAYFPHDKSTMILALSFGGYDDMVMRRICNEYGIRFRDD